MFEPAWLSVIEPVLVDLPSARFDVWEQYLGRLVPVISHDTCEVIGLFAKLPCVDFEDRRIDADSYGDSDVVPTAR